MGIHLELKFLNRHIDGAMNMDEETPLLAASAPSSSSSSKNTTTTTTTTSNNTSLLSKFALGAVALSVVGLIATTASLGGNFNVRDVAGHKLRQGGPSAADIKGAAPVPYDLPPSDITDVLVRVNDPKVFDVPGDSGNPNGPAADASSSSSSSSSKGSLPPLKMAGSGGSETVAAPLTINSVLTPVATVASSPEEQALEDAVTRAKVAGLVLPGSPEDPKLAEEREKKAEVIQVVTEVPEVSAASEVAAEPVAPAGSKGAKAPAAPAAAKEEVEEEVVTGPVQAVVNTGKGTGGKHGEKAKGKNDSTEEAEEVVEEVVEEAADADAEADADADADVPTAEDAKDRVVPESENYSLVDTKLSADNFPFLMHYRYSDESCTKMVAAEGFSLDVCYAAKVGGKDFFQKNVAFTTNSDTGMFSYYYTDKECTNLVQGVKELKENPATMQYKSDCYVEADSSPGRAAVVSVPDIKAVQYERMGLPQESSVIVGSYVNDQCMVPTTFTWKRTDICVFDEIYRCDGTLAHKTSYPASTRCASSGKGADVPFKLDDCQDTATYGIESDFNFQMATCWETQPLAPVEDVAETDAAADTTASKPWWKFWA